MLVDFNVIDKANEPALIRGRQLSSSLQLPLPLKSYWGLESIVNKLVSYLTEPKNQSAYHWGSFHWNGHSKNLQRYCQCQWWNCTVVSSWPLRGFRFCGSWHPYTGPLEQIFSRGVHSVGHLVNWCVYSCFSLWIRWEGWTTAFQGCTPRVFQECSCTLSSDGPALMQCLATSFKLKGLDPLLASEFYYWQDSVGLLQKPRISSTWSLQWWATRVSSWASSFLSVCDWHQRNNHTPQPQIALLRGWWPNILFLSNSCCRSTPS